MGELVVMVSPPPKEKLAKKDGRFFVKARHLKYTYRGFVPVWVQEEVRKGNSFFLVRETHEAPKFLKVVNPEDW